MGRKPDPLLGVGASFARNPGLWERASLATLSSRRRPKIASKARSHEEAQMRSSAHARARSRV